MLAGDGLAVLALVPLPDQPGEGRWRGAGVQGKGGGGRREGGAGWREQGGGKRVEGGGWMEVCRSSAAPEEVGVAGDARHAAHLGGQGWAQLGQGLEGGLGL